MKAIHRANLDEQAGDLGSACRRLTSLASSIAYDPRLCERIARLCVKMCDPVEAGRWYFLTDSSDDESPACITKFLEQFNRHPKQAIRQIPSNLRLESVDRYPPAVRERLRAAEFRGVARKPVWKPGPVSLTQRIGNVGCAVVGILLLISAVVGIGTIVGFIGKLVRARRRDFRSCFCPCAQRHLCLVEPGPSLADRSGPASRG